jgi:hypothetical protein
MLRFICHRQRGATRPLPLALLAFPATGSARITPPLICNSIDTQKGPAEKQVLFICVLRINDIKQTHKSDDKQISA